MSDLEKLHRDLDRVVRTLRNLVHHTSQMDQQDKLGEAARVPDELIRACISAGQARNAVAQELFSTVLAPALTTGDPE